LRTGLRQQPLDRELEVVYLLEAEVDPLGDAADDQPHDGMEVASDRRLELDPLAFWLDQATTSLRTEELIVPWPSTRSRSSRQASWPGAAAWPGRESCNSSRSSPPTARQGSGSA